MADDLFERPVTEKEATELLGLKPQQLRQWRFKGIGPVFHRLGGRVMYLPSELVAFRDARVVYPSKKEPRT